MAILKYEITEKFSKKPKITSENQTTTKTEEPYISEVGAQVLHLACRKGQFAPLVAAGRPRHNKSFQYKFVRSGKNWRYLLLTLDK